MGTSFIVRGVAVPLSFIRIKILLAGLAKRVKAKVLLASTSEVYGDPEVHPQPESYWGNVNPVGEKLSK
jgi:nucleoside-diphosphate-sugar epimerase